MLTTTSDWIKSIRLPVFHNIVPCNREFVSRTINEQNQKIHEVLFSFFFLPSSSSLYGSKGYSNRRRPENVFGAIGTVGGKNGGVQRFDENLRIIVWPSRRFFFSSCKQSREGIRSGKRTRAHSRPRRTDSRNTFSFSIITNIFLQRGRTAGVPRRHTTTLCRTRYFCARVTVKKNTI